MRIVFILIVEKLEIGMRPIRFTRIAARHMSIRVAILHLHAGADVRVCRSAGDICSTPRTWPDQIERNYLRCEFSASTSASFRARRRIKINLQCKVSIP